jgi:hypothetical protein
VRVPSVIKTKSTGDAEITFKMRVQRFWEWYGGAASRLYEAVGAPQSTSLVSEVSARVHEMGPGFAWVFGPGPADQGHSFTVSGEGNLHRQLLTIFWLEQAPNIPGWTFYPARQPGSLKGSQISIKSGKFNPVEFWITPHIDCDEQKLDITVWHPRFETMAERDRWAILFLYLDECLGEYGTQQWVGEIKLDSKRLADSMPLEELVEFLKAVQNERGWKKRPPGESAVSYRLPEPHARFLRGDIVTGTTVHWRLISEYARAEGELADPLNGTGADYVFVALDAGFLPVGNQANARGVIEDALDNSLRTSKSGRLLGGALGTESAYIDLLLFDGASSLDTLVCVLREQGLPPGSSINYFAKEKRGHRLVI